MRFGALAQGKESREEAALLDIIFKDLADMHGITDYDYLPNLKEAYDIIDWYGDQDSSGKFFSPLAISGCSLTATFDRRRVCALRAWTIQEPLP